MKVKKSITYLLIVFMLFTTLQGMGAINANAASGKPVLYVRVDTLDSKYNNNLAVDVLCDRDGVIYGRAVAKGTACTVEDILYTNCFVNVSAGVEATVAIKDGRYSRNLLDGKKIGDVCDVYLLFVDSKGTQYGPYSIKNHKLVYFPAGDGTLTKPYQIWNPRHLYNLREHMAEGLHFKVMQNIDMTGSGYTGKIADYAASFKGTLDGNHCIINNFEGQFFDSINEKGMIHDLFLGNVTCNGNKFGTLNAVIADDNSGTIKDCAIVGGNCTYGTGIFVASNHGDIIGCRAESVNMEAKGNSYAGGIAGTNLGLIKDCYTNVIIHGNSAVGGITGQNRGTVAACSVGEGSIFIAEGSIGGIAGVNQGSSELIGCMSSWHPIDKYDLKQGSIVSGDCGSMGALLCYSDISFPMKITKENGEIMTPEEQAEMLKNFYLRHGDSSVESLFTIPSYYAITWNYKHTFWRPVAIASLVWNQHSYETAEYNQKYGMTLLEGMADNGSTKVAKTSITYLKSIKAKQLTVKYKAIKGADGYEIKYSTDQSFKKDVKTITTKKLSYTVNSLKQSKTYYVKVRAYKLVNGKKVYGTYSGTKSVKTKKS